MIFNFFKTFLTVFALFFFFNATQAECYPDFSEMGSATKCPCVEKFGQCKCPEGQCACIPKQGYCNCQPKKCPCVGQFGACRCPEGQCACVPKQGYCNCQPKKCPCVEQFGACECPEGQCACVQEIGRCDCQPSSNAIDGCYLETCLDPCQIVPLPQHQLYIGPEIYYVNRDKDGQYDRSKQHDFIYGGRVGYDRIKRCRIYWGFDALYATGDLKGHRGNNIKLRFTDANVEARIGYTFQMNRAWLPTIVPYVGYGHFWETSKFKRPSPLLIKQKITFDYIALGFLSQFYPHPSWVVGLNFKTRILVNSKCKITDDPDFDDTSQNVKHKLQFRIELPIIYRLKCWCDHIALSLVPFYEYRHYGEHANFPFDFKDVKLNLYGCDLRLMYMF